MADQAQDGRPDVEIRSTAKVYETMKDDGSWEWTPADLLVAHEAACRWCPESFLSPDVRSVVKWADKHEQSMGHTHSKSERLNSGVGPRDPWAGA